MKAPQIQWWSRNSLGESPKRRMLVHSGCSELSLHRILILIATRARQQLIVGPILTATPRGIS